VCGAMITGPIFRVELISSARRRRYYALRILYSAIILFVLWVTYENVTAYNSFVDGSNTSIAQMARAAAAFFYTFSWVQLIGILLVAPAMAVGTIATERERRTIEYLFVSDLSDIEIVLGKTVARLLLTAQLLLVSLPILFIFRLMGGIPADLLAASFLIAAGTGIFVTAISVCISVWSPRVRDGAMRVYRALAVLFIMPMLLRLLLTIAGSNAWWAQIISDVVSFLLELNPVTILFNSMRNGFAVGVGFDFEPVLRMLAWQLGLSLVLIVFATLAVRRVHLRESSRGAVQERRWQPPRWLRRKKPAMGNNAMIWKEAFAPTSKTKLGVVGYVANVIVVAGAMTWTLYVFYYSALGQQFWSDEWYFTYTGIFTGFIGTGLLLLQGARASSLITVEKERDTWISLISTPLTGPEIVLGKLLGNLYAARWGIALLLVTWGLGLFFNISFAIVIPVFLATYLVCAISVSCIGLLYSLRSKTSLRAMGLTLATIMFMGGGYIACCCPVLELTGPSGDWFELGFAPCMPFLVAAPGVFYAEGIDGGNSADGELAGAYVAGVMFYAVVAASLVAYLTTQFDAAAGRTDDMPDAARLMPRLTTLAES
jgi:ABC-type transport system involved in multi-copper enzyme maturation permease subunit